MPLALSRRQLIQGTAAATAGFGLEGLGIFNSLPVSAAEASLPVGSVKFHGEIEPLVRLLEDTPREQLIEEVASRIRNGLTYREVLAALFLAGIRNVQPRPNVGFKFHAVLVVNSAHIASLASPSEQRWLPIFWAIDHFKSAQAQDVRENNWTMAAADESRVPQAHKARAAFIEAMDRWDENGADAAAAGFARSAGVQDVFELFFRYGARDFRSIGHKAIYVANSWRTLGAIGFEHTEPIARSLAYALMNRENDAGDDPPAERPYKRHVELVQKFPSNWREGKPSDEATLELLNTLRGGSDEDVSRQVVELLSRSVGLQSIWDAYFLAAGELLVRQPGIVALHAVTSTNALRFAFDAAADETTRRLILLQNGAFLALFRGNAEQRNRNSNARNAEFRIDQFEPVTLQNTGKDDKHVEYAQLEELFDTISGDRLKAAGKVLAFLGERGDPREFIQAARVMVFRKGNDSHDYKFSSAVLEDYRHLSPQWRDRYLAASVFNLRGSQGADNRIVERTQTALRA
jgi:hypothetical protein